MNIEDVIDRLSEDLNPQRLEHSIRVMEMSQLLASLNNVDQDKARLAGLLHDCAKYDSQEKIVKEAQDYGLDLDPIFKISPQLIHSELGSYIARSKYGIEDQEILDAIKYHTVGHGNMSKLGKIVYLADLIEAKRNYPGVEALRNLSFENLELGLLKAVDSNLIFLINKGAIIHPNTLELRNSLIVD